MPEGAGAVSVNGGGASTEAPTIAQAPAGPQQDSTMMSTIAERRDRALVGTGLQEGAVAPGSTGFVTPRSQRTPDASQNNWIGVEWPRWVTRLGTMLNIPAIPSPGEFVPSPMLNDGPRPVPPGGHSFVLSPPRRRPTARAPSPPSSSSIPQEAIQAEVQRQLGGLLERLQRAEDDNAALREQLRATQVAENPQPRALLGDLLDEENFPIDLQGKVYVMMIFQVYLEFQAEVKVPGYKKGLFWEEEPGTTTLSPLPEATTTADSALKFQDWVEVTGAAMADVSEQSSIWWASLTKVVEDAYSRWLAATPLERLGIDVVGAKELTEGRWVRVNARVATMLLGSMREDLKMDMVARRISQSCPLMMYRLYTYFQPGGPAERHDLLRRLQSPGDYCKSEALDDVLQTVRSWPRWLSRCRTVNMVPPDASVLAKGLMSLTHKHISSSGDSSFRTSMLRTSLRLDGQPSLDQVFSYQRHLQAELEMMSASTTSTTPGAAVRALEASQGGAMKPKIKDKKKTGEQLCRYFSKPSGCKRGEKCSFSHSMSHLDRDSRSKKCLKCGRESHRQRECPIGKPPQRQVGAPPKEPKATGAPPAPNVSVAAAPSTASSDPTTASTPNVTQGTPWTLENLVQAAQAVVQSQVAKDGESSPEKTQRAEMRVLKVKDVMVCQLKEGSSALLDSGATHCLRTAKNKDEWTMAEEVSVQLAGAATLRMRMNEHGTLLMPPARSDDTGRGGEQSHTIVPLGELVKTLGYTLVWAPAKCYVEDGEGRRTQLSTSRGCPHMCEAEALSLIARVEDRRREQMENSVQATLDQVTIATAMMEQTWTDFMIKYVRAGDADDGRRALRDAPFLQGLPGECLNGLVQADVRDGGWKIFKDIEFLSRAQRRRLWTAKRWVIHLYAGDPGHWEVFKLDKGSTTVLELDIQRCRSHDITRTSTWRLLMWGAMMGKIDVILGGPSGRGGFPVDMGRATPNDQKSMTMVTRMMWLYAVAKETPRLQKMTAAQWKQHVDSGHINYNRECLTCVMGRGTGRRHGRIRHPEMFSLTLDLAGPVQPGLDVTSKGTMGKGLRYLLAAKFTLPKEFVKAYSGQEPPAGDGTEFTMDPEILHEEGQEERKELIKPSLQPPQEGGDHEGDFLDKFSFIEEREELKKPSLQPPHEGGYPFIYDTDEPGEQGPVFDESDEPGEQGLSQPGEAITPGTASFLGATKEQKVLFEEEDHSLYVPSELEEDDRPEDQEEDVHKGRRRVVGKLPVERVDMKVVSVDKSTTPAKVEEQATSLLEVWTIEEAYQFVDELAEADFFTERKFGVYRHGGAVGWLTGFAEFPQVSRALAKMVTEIVPEATFTSIWVSRNIQRLMHTDQNNDENTFNYAIPIRVPKKGGELWVELRKGDKVCGPLKEKVGDKGQRYYGHLLDQRLGECNIFPPRRRHEVEPWMGTRTLLIAYTPQCMGKLTYDMIQSLEDHGFQPPLSQLPEFFVRNQSTIKMRAMDGDEVKFEEEPGNRGDLQEREDSSQNEWEMYLNVTDGYVKVEDAAGDFLYRQPPQLAKAELGYVKNVEQKLAALSGPLEVTYQVDPKEVMEHLSLWDDAIRKEIKNIEVAIIRLQRGDPAREDWLSKPAVQRLPAKFVFTIKPNSEAKSGDRTTWYKRKARLVVCGNLARPDTSELYTEAAPAEAVRMSLVLAKQRSWIVGVLDVVAAFLKTPIGTSVNHPVILIQPPKLLQALNLAAPLELWALVRALYGLRQSPALWAEHRDYTIERDKIPIGKEQAVYEVLDSDPTPDEAQINLAQTLTGELLWVKAEDNAIRLFPDAAFAPSATVALSTAESELNAILEGGIAVLGLESMLYDLNIHVEERVVLSDSMSALTISSGTGSWRTRHLRIKASWLQEMLTAGSITARHCPGVVQPADLLTKALPSQRLCDLLELWGVGEVIDGEGKSKEVNTKAQVPAAKMLVAMLCCMMFLGTEARDLNDDPGPQIDYDMAGILVILLVILGGLIVYEVVKWVCLEFYREWTPGASKRKLRRLEKLRDATARAIHDELERQGRVSEPVRAPTSSSSSTRPPRQENLQPAWTSEEVRMAQPSASTPRASRTVQSEPIQGSPGQWSVTSDHEERDDQEDCRVCTDLVMLMSVEELKSALRSLSLPVGGLKPDQAARLGAHIASNMRTNRAITRRQGRYLLWLWRNKDLQGKVLLHYDNIRDRTEASRTIHRWKTMF
ncbi:unnamed protein product [Symbiodinium microadriaticum]|nr:unnamed protein product [Symbiodinium microadriaticum]CAE7329154.1 unnamed protein product [Symbiodinium sp. KB8]